MKRRTIYLIGLTALAGTLVWLFAGAPGLRIHFNARRQEATVPRILPERTADPNRAPQREIDSALFADEEFFGVRAYLPRATQEARERLGRLIEAYPKDPQLRLTAAQLDVRLGQADRAAEQMRRYVELESRSAQALNTLAVFYDSRAEFADEVRTLMELAPRSPREHRSAIYRRAMTVVRDHRPAGLDSEKLYREMFENNPTDFTPIKSYVDGLVAERQCDRALAVIDEFRARFSNNPYLFLQEKANIYLEQKRNDAALELYEKVFDPLGPQHIAGQYYGLLKRLDRYRTYRRDLRQRFDSGAADFQTMTRLFSLYVSESNLAEAGRVLGEYENRRATVGAPVPGRPQSLGDSVEITGEGLATVSRAATEGRPDSGAELETVGAMFARIGNYDQASRYYHTLYLTGAFQADRALRERGLERLFRALMEADSRRMRLASGDLSLYKDIATVDQSPGLLNGVLSLILADTQLPYQFKEREAQAERLFNVMLAHRVFEAFKRDYSESKELPQMYLAMVDSFMGYKQYALAADLGRQFLSRYPDSPSYEPVSLRVADAYRAMREYDGERRLYQALLDRAAARQPEGRPLIPYTPAPWMFSPSSRWAAGPDYQDRETSSSDERDQSERPPDDAAGEQRSSSPSPQETIYKTALDRYIASLTAEKKLEEILRLYWSEIQKHPQEEGLYELMLHWLEQTNLFDEKLRGYREAVRRFPETSWYHRLARWLIGEQHRGAFRQYSREIVETLDGEEIRGYLQEFLDTPYGLTTPESQFYLQMYRFAHQRFPHNLSFVHGLLRYYSPNASGEWERLNKQYFFADSTIRDSLLREWSRTKELKSHYLQARRQAESSLAYRWFVADAAIWMCRYEEAVAAYTQVSERYPGDPQPAERLATLFRSFGQKDEQNFVRAGNVLSRLGDVYPTDHEYRTMAGEAYVDYGDNEAAGKEWDKMLAVESGRRATYLEVATIYWDYYMFDDAVRTIKALREATGDETLYAYHAGAVYESKRDYTSAVAEYMKELGSAGGGQYTVVRRLAFLAKRRGMKEAIKQAYEPYARAHPDNSRLPIGYDQYLQAIEAYDEEVKFLEKEAGWRNQIDFLTHARWRFQATRRFKAEEKALNRILALGSTEVQEMRNRLQLASYYEQRRDTDKAAQIVEALVTKYPTNYGVLDGAVRFYWRVERRDRTVELYRAMAERARGGYVRAFKLELARRLTEMTRFDEAEKVLRAVYADDSADMEAFGQLVSVLSKAGRMDDVVELYRTGITKIRELPTTRDEQRDRIAELRRAMIGVYTKLGKHTEAVDQHIEIVNRDADNRAVVNAAMDYATRHNLADRVVAYYEKTAQSSHRDYRWNQVLAWIYEYRGELEKVADEWKLALDNEPQRLDFRSDYADALVRLDRYDQAIEQLRRAHQLSGAEPSWLVRIAQTCARQGNHEVAVRTLSEALRSSRVNSQNIFEYARLLESWGLSREADEFYKSGFDRLLKNFYDEPIPAATQLDGFVRASLRAGNAQEMFNRLLDAREWAERERTRAKNLQAGHAQEFQSRIETVLRNSFGRHLAEFAEPAEIAPVVEAIKARVAPLTGYDTIARSDLQLFASLAHNARLADVEEQILGQLTDTAFRAPWNPQQQSRYDELRTLISFYDSRGAYAQAANVLQSYYERDRNRWFDYLGALANHYRWAGDADNELTILRRIYQLQGGELTDRQDGLTERYFALLYQKGLREELSQVMQRYSPHQLQLVNFLLARGEKELARTALEQTRMAAGWIKSRQAQVGYYFNDTSPRVAEDFRSSLRLQPIGELIAKRPDARQVVIGDDWYRTAWVYGRWLDLKPETEPQARKHIVALIENHPRQASDQLELVEYYFKRKQFDRALSHIELTMELAPESLRAKRLVGDIYWEQGKKKEAKAAWDRLISRKWSNANEHLVYLDALTEHGLKEQALGPVQECLTRSIKAFVFDDQVKSLVRRVVEVYGTPTATALFEALVAQTASNTNLAEMVINEELLPKERLTPFYRAMVAFHQQSTPAYSGRRSYYEEQSQASPFETWERRLVEYLIEQGQLLSAEQEIASFKQTLHPRAPTPDWCTLDQAKIEIRSSRREEALKRLREWITSAGSESAPNKERFLQVSALLNAEGLRREANEFLLDMYSRLLTSGERNNANFIGLAEVLFNLDRTQEALDALRRMVNRSLDHYETLPLAAEVAFRYKRFGEAMEYRSRLAKMNAEAAENQVELARAQAAAGNVRAAVETLAALLKDRKTSGTTAATAIELLPDLIKENPQQALAWVPADSNRLLAARAAILRQAGQRDQALRALEPALADRYNVAARIERALIEQPAKLQSWEEVLFMDPEEGIANSFVFAASTPRMQLARLYVQVGRHEAALKIGESVVSSQVSVVRGQSSVVGSSEQRTTGDEQRTNPLGTMQERNAAAVGEQRIELLETLAQAARKLGNYQRALEFLQARRALLREASAIRATEQLIAEVKREKEQADRRAVERMVISRNEVHLGLK